MADWLIPLPLLGLGVLGLVLGATLLPAGHALGVGTGLLASVMQAAWSGVDALGLGLALGYALVSALLALSQVPAPCPQSAGWNSLGGSGRSATSHQPRSLPGLDLLLASASIGLLALDGRIDQGEGALLIVAGLGYLLIACSGQAPGETFAWIQDDRSGRRDEGGVGWARRLQTYIQAPLAAVRQPLSWLLCRLAALLAALILIGVSVRLILIGTLDLGATLGLRPYALGLGLGTGLGLIGFGKARPDNAYLLGVLVLTCVLGSAALTTPAGLDCRRVPPASWWILAATGALGWRSLGQGSDPPRVSHPKTLVLPRGAGSAEHHPSPLPAGAGFCTGERCVQAETDADRGPEGLSQV